MPRTRVKGGKALAKFMRASKRAGAAKPKEIDVGFHDRRIAALAGQLEFGNPAQNLPERPAFRSGVSDLKRSLPKVVRSAVAKNWAKGISVSHEEAVEVGTEARDTLKAAYLTFVGPGVGEAQESRKRGTPGEGRELVGSSGPKLIERIEARIGDKVL